MLGWWLAGPQEAEPRVGEIAVAVGLALDDLEAASATLPHFHIRMMYRVLVTGTGLKDQRWLPKSAGRAIEVPASLDAFLAHPEFVA
jgi:hypothetical protein